MKIVEEVKITEKVKLFKNWLEAIAHNVSLVPMFFIISHLTGKTCHVEMISVCSSDWFFLLVNIFEHPGSEFNTCEYSGALSPTSQDSGAALLFGVMLLPKETKVRPPTKGSICRRWRSISADDCNQGIETHNCFWHQKHPWRNSYSSEPRGPVKKQVFYGQADH